MQQRTVSQKHSSVPSELFPEWIEEQIVDILVPPVEEEIAEEVQIIPQERFTSSCDRLCEAFSCDQIHRTSANNDIQ